MYKAQGKEPPKEMDDTVVYNRGILWAAVHVEAIRNALKATGGKQPTGEDVKKGFESIHDFSLGGLVAMRYVLDCLERGKPRSVVGLLLYASPTTGTHIAKIAELLGLVIGVKVRDSP